MAVRRRLHVLFAAPEVVPFSKTEGMADRVVALPKALAAGKQQVRVILRRYRATQAGGTVYQNLTVPLHGGPGFADIRQGTP